MKHLNIALLIGILTTSCGIVKPQVVVETKTEVQYKEVLVPVHDTIEVQLPSESKEITIKTDSSYLETSIAESTAKIDSVGILHHTLNNKKGSITKVIEYQDKIIYRDSIVTKEVPVIQEVIVAKRDTFFWILLGMSILFILSIILKFVK